MAHDNEVRERGVYGVFSSNFSEGKLMYVGSTQLKLEWLEENHRKWRDKKYSPTFFRQNLDEYGETWVFKWLILPILCDQSEIERQEGNLIRCLNPHLNVDKDPVASSKKYGRY